MRPYALAAFDASLGGDTPATSAVELSLQYPDTILAAAGFAIP